MITEKDAWSMNGYVGVFVILVIIGVGIFNFFHDELWIGIIFLIIGSIALMGLIIFRKGKLGRIEGSLLTLMYIGYFIYIFMRDFR